MLKERTKVFISYSHQDRDWLERLRVHLKPLERNLKIEIWDDSRIKPGSKWRKEIKEAVNSAKVAVLLISADFLASDFITDDELPPLLNAAEEDGAIILPVLISPSRFLKSKGLAQFQAVNSPSSFLINMTRGEQEAIFVNVSEYIEAALTSSEVKEKPTGILNRLEATVSNPNYKSDLKALEDKWDLAQVLTPKTVIIVTGSHVICELLDRPVAEIIRDEIDRQGNVFTGERGIIIGDLWWFKDTDLQSHPVLSIGGPSVNPLTKEITSQGNTSKYSAGVFWSVIEGQFLRVAIWGRDAAQTRAGVEFYIQHPEGLTRLLDTCWNR